MEKQLLPVAKRVIHENSIEIKKGTDVEKIYEKIAFHLDSLIHNVTSTAALVAMLHNNPKIESEHLKPVKMYIESQCLKRTPKNQRGGAVMASDFFGYPHPNYSPSNENSGVLAMSKVDLNGGEARPSLGPAKGMFVGGGARNGSPEIKSAVKALLKHRHVSISKRALDELISIIETHIQCFSKDLIDACPLTNSKIDRVLHMKRHAVFQ